MLVFNSKCNAEANAIFLSRVIVNKKIRVNGLNLKLEHYIRTGSRL